MAGPSFDNFCILDPKREQDQVAACLGGTPFTQWTAYDPVLYRRQIEAAAGKSMFNQWSAIDPAIAEAQMAASITCGGGYSAKAVHFDGSTYLATASLSATDSQYFLCSLWIKGTRTLATYFPSFFVCDPNDFYAPFLTGIYFSSGAGDYIDLAGGGSPNPYTLDNSAHGGFTAIMDNLWHNIIFAENSLLDPGPNSSLYIDAVKVATFAQETIPGINIFNGKSFYIGSDTFGASDTFKGDMADFFLLVGPAANVIDGSGNIANSVIQKFIKDGKPVNLGADGSAPFGVQPMVFCSGDSAAFAINNGTGGALTVTGALTDASTSPSD